MQATIRRFVAGTLSALLVSACGEGGTSPGAKTQGEAAHAILQAELARTLEVAWPDLAFDPAATTFRSTPSVVVPGVTYHMAVHAPPGTRDVWYEASAGSGPGGARLLRTPRDWVAILGGWVAADAKSAAEACWEMVYAVEGPERGPLAWVASGDSTPDPGYLGPEEREQVRSRIAAPAARRADGGTWLARTWVVQPRDPYGAVLYECRLPASPGAEDPAYTAVDSVVVEPGLP